MYKLNSAMFAGEGGFKVYPSPFVLKSTAKESEIKQERRVTTAELKDAAIFFIAYSFLKMDCDSKLGVFVDETASRYIEELVVAMEQVVRHYQEFKKRIETQISSLDNKALVRKESYGTTAPQLACDLLYLRFAPNERKGQRLSPVIADFYDKNKEKISYIVNRSYDTNYSKEAEDSQRLAYFYIENI